MKNKQKGFVIPLLVIIAVVVIGGIAYFVVENNQKTTSQSTAAKATDTVSGSQAQSQNGQTTFAHPSGLYTFSYPSDWQFPAANIFSKIASTYYPLDMFLQKSSPAGKNTNRFTIEVNADQTLASNFEKAAHMAGSKNYTKENITIDGIVGYRMEYQETILGQDVDEVMYVIPLTYNGSSAVLSVGIDAWDSSWLGIAEPVAKSLKIDLSKVPSAVKQMNSTGAK